MALRSLMLISNSFGIKKKNKINGTLKLLELNQANMTAEEKKRADKLAPILEQQKALLEQLSKMPIIQIIGRVGSCLRLILLPICLI